jgi:beta-galactosidase
METIRFGVDYYPEHWPKERWGADAVLMREAGIEVVRMAEFAWAKMEPEPGRYDFNWLDEAIDVLAKEGIKTVLGTPTAAPPAWMIERHPEILPVRRDGTRVSFGGRHHDCQSNQTYRGYIVRFVRLMAQHFRDNPNVVGWQVDNELGNSHQQLCFCDSCHRSFHSWLKRKYVTIERLNEAWGTVFWSQIYDSFDQIPTPAPTPNSHNPSLLLDWRRFTSDLIVDFQKLQIDILRKECPGHFITHNFMGFFDKTDYYDLARDLDVVSVSHYPRLFIEGERLSPPMTDLAATLDLMRGTKQKSFWIMEQQAGPSGWETLGSTPRPGQLRLWTYQSVARGADTVVYFRWRTCLFGTEEYWHGILPHSGDPGRRYQEIRKTIRELTPLMQKWKDALPCSEVAILYSYDERWALQIQPHHPELDYVEQLRKYYRPLCNANVPVDFISEEADFSPYKLIIAPLLFLMTPELSSKLKNYVSRGGSLVLTMRTAVKDWNNRVLPQTLPGGLAELLGLKILDYECLRSGAQKVRWAASSSERGESYAAEKWCDIITTDGAETLAIYTSGYYEGTPAMTQNAWGEGFAYYVGTEPDASLLEMFLRYLLDRTGVEPILQTPPEIEVTRRRDEKRHYNFLLNHSPETIEINMPSGWKPLLGEKRKGGTLVLAPYDVAVFSSPR